MSLTNEELDAVASEGPDLTLLGKRIDPGSSLELEALGANVLPKQDLVLTHLALSDEREYEKMRRTDDAISGAMEQRICGLLDPGSVVVEASSSAAARLLKDFAVSALRFIDRFPSVQRDLLLAIYYGWRPAELEWSGGLTFQGRNHFGVRKIVPRKPWHYHITRGGMVVRAEAAIARAPADDDPMTRLRWMVCSAGEVESPYGDAWLRRLWLVFFLSKELERLGVRAMKRALGLIKLAETGARSPLSIAKAAEPPALEDVKGRSPQLARLIQSIDSDQLIVEQAGWSVEFMEAVDNISGSVQMLEFFDEKKRIALVGQTLTTKVNQDGGSFAAEEGHRAILGSFLRADGRDLASWINDLLLRPLIRINFPTADPDDFPRWKPRVLLDDQGLEGPEAQVQSPVNPVSLPRPERSATTRAAGPDDRLDDLRRDSVDAAAQELERYYGGLLARFQATNPDPKAVRPSDR